MNWITAGFLVFVCSVAMYLLVRKCNFLKVPAVWQNLAMYAVPLVLYLFLAPFSHTSLAVNWQQLSVLVMAGVFFSYLGNVFSLKSIEYAPNPGYSLILSKSYVVFTTLVSFLVFHGELTLKSGIAIILIVIFSGLVVIGKPKTDQSHVRSSWLPLAIGAFFCWGMLAIASKYLLDSGLSIYARLIYIFAMVTCLALIEMWQTKQYRVRFSPTIVISLFLIGILGGAFNYFLQLGYQLAPNVGYISAINAASIAGVTLLSAWVFKDELTQRKLVGVLGVVVGLMLLVL